MNTKKSGTLTFLFFKEGVEKEWTGICRELCMVKTAKDIGDLKKDLIVGAFCYVKSVITENEPDDLLNEGHLLPKKYQKLFEQYPKIEKKPEGFIWHIQETYSKKMINAECYAK